MNEAKRRASQSSNPRRRSSARAPKKKAARRDIETANSPACADMEYYSSALKEALAGDRSSAMELLYGFCDAAASRSPIPAPIIDFLLRGFSVYLQSKNTGTSDALALRSALLLTPRSHRQKGRSTREHDAVRVAAHFNLQQQGGATRKQALFDTAKHFRISQRQVERDDQKCNLIRSKSVPILALLAQPIRPSRVKK